MPAKYVVLFSILAVLLMAAACYLRWINIDNIIRRNDKPVLNNSVVIQDLDHGFTYGSNGENIIVNDKPLKIYSSCIPPVVIKLKQSDDRQHIIVADSGGREFILGIKSIETRDNSTYYTLHFDEKDKVVFKSSYSLVPYYYGYFIMSTSPVSRYYHYYSLSVTRESGSALVVEWKFSTYKGKDGKLIPDLFGDNKEGLVNLVIR